MPRRQVGAAPLPDAEGKRAQALLEGSGQAATSHDALRRFARIARQRIRFDGGGNRRARMRTESAEGTIGPFGGLISKLTIPGRWLGGVALEAEPEIDPVAEGGLRICFEGRTLLYDRLGLRVAQPGNTAKAP